MTIRLTVRKPGEPASKRTNPFQNPVDQADCLMALLKNSLLTLAAQATSVTVSLLDVVGCHGLAD